MSYYAPISFKTIKEGELYAFLKKIKDTCKEKIDDIAKKNFLYMPTLNTCKRRVFEGASDTVKREANEAWVRNSVFSYRFFYIPEHNLLGVFSIPDAVIDIFDCTVHFQNSCDQNYDFEEWKGIPLFEKIAEKWKACPIEEVAKYMEQEDDIDYMRRLEERSPQYYAKSACYDEIWETYCEKYLYNEDEVVYLSLFGFYETSEKRGFIKKCKEAYETWVKECEEDYKKKHNESEDTE